MWSSRKIQRLAGPARSSWLRASAPTLRQPQRSFFDSSDLMSKAKDPAFVANMIRQMGSNPKTRTMMMQQIPKDKIPALRAYMLSDPKNFPPGEFEWFLKTEEAEKPPVIENPKPSSSSGGSSSGTKTRAQLQMEARQARLKQKNEGRGAKASETSAEEAPRAPEQKKPQVYEEDLAALEARALKMQQEAIRKQQEQASAPSKDSQQQDELRRMEQERQRRERERLDREDREAEERKLKLQQQQKEKEKETLRQKEQETKTSPPFDSAKMDQAFGMLGKDNPFKNNPEMMKMAESLMKDPAKMEQMTKMAQGMFGGKDGKMPDMGEIGKMFAQADTNKDGVLSEKEFSDWTATQRFRSDTLSTPAVAEASKPAGDSSSGSDSGDSGAHSGPLSNVPEPMKVQLLLLALRIAPPFVVFGFLDNLLMLVAGDMIDQAFGVALGLSAMAAAGLGNTVGDVISIATSGYIEQMMSKLRIPSPMLSQAQMQLPVTRRVAILSRALAIMIGCLLGLIPLLFIGGEDLETKTEKMLQSSEFETNARRVFEAFDSNHDRVLSGQEIVQLAQSFLSDSDMSSITEGNKKSDQEIVKELAALYAQDQPVDEWSFEEFLELSKDLVRSKVRGLTLTQLTEQRVKPPPKELTEEEQQEMLFREQELLDRVRWEHRIAALDREVVQKEEQEAQEALQKAIARHELNKGSASSPNGKGSDDESDGGSSWFGWLGYLRFW